MSSSTGTGTALLPAIVWQDGRCAEIAAELDGQVSAEQKLAWWGALFPIGASNVAARMAWVARHHPAASGNEQPMCCRPRITACSS